MHPMLNIAMAASREAGKIMLRSYDDLASRSDNLEKKLKFVDKARHKKLYRTLPSTLRYDATGSTKMCEAG